MYCIIQNGKITGISENYISSENGTTIEKDFTNEELKKINDGYSYNIDTGLFEASIEILAKEKLEKISEIRQKYQDLIFEKYSLTTQLNMSHSVNEILTNAIVEKRYFTEEEKKILSQNDEMKIWIDEQRNLCSQEISNIS